MNVKNKRSGGVSFCPAKQKAEGDALGIGCGGIQMVWVIYRDYGVSIMQ